MTTSLEFVWTKLVPILERKLDRLGDLSIYPFFTGPTSRLYYVYLISFVLIGLGVYFWERRREPRHGPQRLSTMLSFLFPGRVYLHESSLLDYRYYLINRLVMKAVKLVNTGAVFVVASGSVALLSDLVLGGQRGAIDARSPSVLLVYAVATFLVLDFAAFLSHYLHHRIPILWEFHKVHHSARVLTPITNFRNHPLNNVVDSLALGLFAGALNGVFEFLAGTELTSPEFLTVGFLNVGVFLFASNLFQNLMHSHIWLSYGRVLNHVFISPAQHQIHHSREPRHLDRNLGLVLSLWDWMFGTLYLPRGRESFELGLAGATQDDYDSVARIYLVPFRRALRLALGARRSA